MRADPVHEELMRRALDRARAARDAGEVPIGAVVVLEGRVVGEGSNQPIGAGDPTESIVFWALSAGSNSLSAIRPPAPTASRLAAC